MKRIVLYSFWLLSLAACNSGMTDMKSDLENANLKGRVQYVEQTVHDAEARSACPAACSSEAFRTFYVYNTDGNLHRTSLIDEDGDTTSVSVYRYNRKGICKSIDIYKAGDLTGREIPQFDMGKMTALKIESGEGENQACYKYSYSGENVENETYLDKKGNTKSSVRNEYEGGKLVSQERLDSAGKIINKRYFKLNASNEITEYRIEVPENGSEFLFRFDYDYDEAGNWIKQTQYYNDRIISVTVRNIFYYPAGS